MRTILSIQKIIIIKFCTFIHINDSYVWNVLCFIIRKICRQMNVCTIHMGQICFNSGRLWQSFKIKTQYKTINI